VFYHKVNGLIVGYGMRKWWFDNGQLADENNYFDWKLDGVCVL